MLNKNVKEINKMLSLAFGEGTIGNYCPHAEVEMCGDKIEGGNKLECIAKRGKFRIPYIWHNYNIVGKFLPESSGYKRGAILEVLPEYESAAQEYADLFEVHFKRKASVSIKNKKERI